MPKLFFNEFLDKLLICTLPYEQAKDLRKFGTNKSRAELSEIIGLSSETIRRYESKWNKQKIPPWYFVLLRFLCGDLSFFGNHWKECRIYAHDQTLASPYTPHTRMRPADMNSQYSRIYQVAQQELGDLRNEIKRLKDLNQALLIENTGLNIRIDTLESKIISIKERHQLVKNDKVV